MKNDILSVALISNDPDVNASASNALRADPNLHVEQIDDSLPELNGHVRDLAQAHDLIIFQSNGETDRDVAALQRIQNGAGSKARILALTDAGTTLKDIRRLTRAGVQEILPTPISSDELVEVVRKWSAPPAAQQIETPAPVRKGKVISVAKARGGIGATTLAVNLADRLMQRKGFLRQETQANVVVVDLDLQFGDVGAFLDQAPNNAIYEMAVQGLNPDATYVSQAVTRMEDGLSVLAGPDRFAPLTALSATQVETLIRHLQTQFDFVVIDMPGALVEWISPILAITDKMLLVTDSAVPSVRKARQYIDFITEDRMDLPIDIIMNFEKKPLLHGRHHTEASKVLERTFRHWLPPDPKAAREALDRGVPLSKAAGRSALSKSIRLLAQDLVTEFQSLSEQTAKLT